VSENEIVPNNHSQVSFDYCQCLASACKKHWKFIDAIYGVLPLFGMVLRKGACNSINSNERFKELALQVISTQVSDEVNISRLIVLANQQQIKRFDITLPYPLTAQQLSNIQEEYAKPVQLHWQGDYLTITLID
jgi:hypothetical protein